eukprot:scaffold27.g6022.t1
MRPDAASTLDEALAVLRTEMEEAIEPTAEEARPAAGAQPAAAGAGHAPAAARQPPPRRSNMLAAADSALVDEAIQELRERLPAEDTPLPPASPPGDPTCPAAETPRARVLAAIHTHLRAIRAERRTLVRKDKLKAWERAVAAWRARYAQQPKWGHRDIAAGDADRARGIEVLQDPGTGSLTSDPPDLLRILRGQRQRTASAPASGKTGQYSTDTPQRGARGYPWEAPGAADAYVFCTRAPPASEREDLLPRVKDFVLFSSILRRAANNKSPGPDGMPNELLKFLPCDLQRGIHHMFVAMWLTGETPAAWKDSHTVMLYKKGDPADPGNYRPVGLALTIYKLWTALLTAVLSDYAERHAILTDSQAGFRYGRSTHQALFSMLNALEDARLYNRHIYMLYVDFCAAFDMANHDKLLQLMHDMGFPHHAVRAVQHLYTGAHTTIRTAFGDSEPIPIDRGTLQGDSLSPFLFLLFIEPLLRWLHWSEMAVNHKRCGVTGMIYGAAANGSVSWGAPGRDAIRTLSCRLHQQDRERGGLRVTSVETMYATELVAKLTEALNDEGRTGRVTTCLLHEQGKWRLQHDPADLGARTTVPSTYFLPLLEAGVTSLSQLLEPAGTHMVKASQLAAHLRGRGVAAEDSRELRQAMNRVTVCLTTLPEHGAHTDIRVGPTDLSADRKRVRATHLVGTAPLHPAPATDGQRPITEYLRPDTHEGHAQNGEPEQQQDAEPAARQPAAARRRARARRAPARYDWLEEACNDARAPIVLYNKRDEPTRIISDCQRQAPTREGRPSKKAKRTTQKLYTVEWANTIIRPRFLPVYARLGYTPAAAPLPVNEDGATNPAGGWVLVAWNPSNEPQEGFEERYPNGAALVADYTRRREEAEAAAAAAAAQLPTLGTVEERLRQQGIQAQPRRAWDYAHPDAPSLISLDASPTHPELPPQGTTAPFIRVAAQPGGAPALAHVHDCQGRWLVTLSCARLALLRERFLGAQAARPHLFEELGASSFETEVARLLGRWRAPPPRPQDAAGNQGMPSGMRIAVIGGGWYGCHIGSELIRLGHEVVIYEKSPELFAGSSGYNQFRLHLGFHYPRSSKTRHQIVAAYERFLSKYPHLFFPVTTNVYGISLGDSIMDFQTYKTVMQHDGPGVEFEEIDPASIGLTGLEGALVCREGALLAQEPKRFFSSLLREHVRFNHCVESVRTLSDNEGWPSGVEVDGVAYDWCIDCTYGQLLNHCQGEIRYEVCLTLVYKRKDKNVLHMHHAFTIMDGPFTSLFPCFEDYADATGDLNRLHTLTHVQHTHLKRFDNFAEAQAYVAAFTEADAQQMRPLFEEGILHYLPTFLRDYTYHDYFLSYKTKTTGGADSRETVCSTQGRVISVMSGKVNTIFLAEDYVMDAINEVRAASACGHAG